MKRLIKLIAGLLIGPGAALAQQAVDAAGVKAAQAAGGILLDVRRPGELTKSGLVRGARHADFTSPEFAQRLAALQLDKAQPVVVYCHSGGRAQLVAQQLQQQGYQVRWFDGMLSELKAAGVPFEPWTGAAK